MFRIRRVFDDLLPVNESAVRQTQEMLRAQFSAVPQDEIDTLPEKLRNPVKLRFSPILLVAEKRSSTVVGFALLLHDPDLSFCYLDFLASHKALSGRGVGGALYERVRDEARLLGAKGLFFECLPDEPAACSKPEFARQNAARLKFYEQYGARPIVGTAYETPVKPGDMDMPHLVYDGLDMHTAPRRAHLRQVVRAILERKYGQLCSPEYTNTVVQSIQDDPVKIREPKYHKAAAPARTANGHTLREPIALVINDKHDIHHIRERGYVESPVRIKAILSELNPSGLFDTIAPRQYPERHILEVHTADFVDYLKRACASVGVGKSVYPYVFPIRNATRPPKELSVLAGYYCIDTFTPINGNVYLAAKRAVDCTLTAADEILRGRRLAYSLVRPPGHHAERRVFGGFCYFNNAAVAAHYLARHGRVAIIDVDYHHGNGQQEIFYERCDVLTVSLHGHPEFAYPYFTGFADETGQGIGAGFNLNIPLPEKITPDEYRGALAQALEAVRQFHPVVLIVALGLDPAKGDPTGTWSLRADDFRRNGRMLGQLGLPTLVVQEGGYLTRTLGNNARGFFQGLMEGAYAA